MNVGIFHGLVSPPSLSAVWITANSSFSECCRWDNPPISQFVNWINSRQRRWNCVFLKHSDCDGAFRDLSEYELLLGLSKILFNCNLHNLTLMNYDFYLVNISFVSGRDSQCGGGGGRGPVTLAASRLALCSILLPLLAWWFCAWMEEQIDCNKRPCKPWQCFNLDSDESSLLSRRGKSLLTQKNTVIIHIFKPEIVANY